jgi:hypothetical protein
LLSETDAGNWRYRLLPGIQTRIEDKLVRGVELPARRHPKLFENVARSSVTTRTDGYDGQADRVHPDGRRHPNKSHNREV